MWTFVSFITFIGFVAFYSWYRLRKQNLRSSDGYFLGGRSLSAIVIAGSMLLTNISSEHLAGMNGSAYKNGLIIILGGNRCIGINSGCHLFCSTLP
jgi:SSS family solute:Na+ symporter